MFNIFNTGIRVKNNNPLANVHPMDIGVLIPASNQYNKLVELKNKYGGRMTKMVTDVFTKLKSEGNFNQSDYDMSMFLAYNVDQGIEVFD